MWWHEQVAVWLDMAPFQREVPLLALIAIVDAFTGLSQIAAMKLGFAKRREVILLAVLLVLEIRFMYWNDFLPWKALLRETPNNPAVFDAWLHLLHVSYMYGIAFEIIVGSCAIICAVWAKLQKRSFFLWLLIGLLGTFGSVVWLFVNRSEARDQGLESVRQVG